jgi:hypothetical protein
LGRLAALPEEILLRVILAEIARIRPAARPPRLEQAEALLGRLTATAATGLPFRTTLGGALIDGDPSCDRLTIAPEPARSPSVAAATPRHTEGMSEFLHADCSFAAGDSESPPVSLGKERPDA